MEDKQKNSILIIDDEQSNLKALTHILGPDYLIYTAKNGANALEKAQELVPDLILLDIIMPDMDGFEVLTILKKTDNISQIPVIVITGLSSSEDEEKGLALRAADYISKPFSASIVKLRVRNQIQIVNQMRTIERLSMIDQLTGLPNRRSFDDRMQTGWMLAIREPSPISILMIDVDNFKVYNDTYGHQQGDVVLQTMTKVFSNVLHRQTDFAARWGGEEFVALLSTTDGKNAVNIAEQIRAEMEKTEIPCKDGSITKVTVSIGVNTELPEHNSSLTKFIAAADEALYRAKRDGRNRVEFASVKSEEDAK
jgi:diguanylate cyclase (GGDEF)-like protein